MLAQSMRPKFKTDTYYIPMSDGVYLRGNNNRLLLKGKSLYRLLEHLVPHLNGKATLAEITGGLDEDRKRMVINLLTKLLDHDFLKDTGQDQPHTLCPVELETYASDITFVESFQTSAAYRFECFRNKQLLIIGSGSGFISLVRASLQCGLKQINAIKTSEDEFGAHSLQEILDLVVTDASEQPLLLIDAPAWDNEIGVRNTIQSYDAILHIAEQPMLARAQLLNRLCIEKQKTFIQAISVDDHVWFGPLVGPETSACWECAWRRLQANLTDISEQRSHYQFYDQPLVSSCPLLTMPQATMIANRLIFELFQHFTQIGSTKLTGKLNAINLATGQSESHAFLPHPHCQSCQHPIAPTASQFLEQIQQLQHQGPIEPSIFLENFVSCVDNRLGLFTALDDNFVQAPLAVYKVHLSNPMLKKLRSEAFDVIAASTDTKDAILCATQKACIRYASSLVDQRRLLSAEIVQRHTFSIISTDQLIAIKTFSPETFSSEGEMWTWALDLQTQQATLVPATHVFSSFYNQERGVAAGKTWDEATCLALLDWCNYLTVGQLKDVQRTYRQVDLVRTPLTPEGRHLYRLLNMAVGQVAVYDITGILQVPTFATCVGEKVVAYSTHYDEAQALRIGFELALQQYQSEHFQQHDYAVAPVPDLPLILRRKQLFVPHPMLLDTWTARKEWLLQQLQSNNLRAFAIPLDHDPALMQVLPFIVRVLLSRRVLKKGE